MGLLYSFRHLFYGENFHKDRLYKLLEKLDVRITALEQGVDLDGVSIDDIKDAELHKSQATNRGVVKWVFLTMPNPL